MLPSASRVVKLIGHHRSLELAERHASDLRRNNPGAVVSIVERRNNKGEFSARGHRFTFLIEREIEQDEWETWAITFEYP